jgi:dipeptidyl aminopeptidase/acylaminoacyl peptidase
MVRARPLLCPLLLAAAAAATAAPRPPTAAELVALSSPSDLALAPDGRRVAYALATRALDPAAQPSEADTGGGWKEERQLWLLDLAARRTRVLTQGPGPTSSPRWSPDGRQLAFLRKAGNKVALQVLALEGGEARTIDTGALELEAFRWTADGRGFTVLAPAPPTPAEQAAAWRDGGAFAWATRQPSHRAWRVPVEGGAPVALTGPEQHVAALEPSPDGKRLAVLTASSADPYQVFTRLTARVLSAADGAELQALERPAQLLTGLRWSPDGRRLALIGQQGGVSLSNALLLWDPAGRSARDLAPDRDLTFAAAAFDEGGGVLAVVKARTRTLLWRFPATGGRPEELGFSGRTITSELESDAGGRLLTFLSSTLGAPEEVTTFEVGARRAAVVTALHPQVAGWSLGDGEVVRWKNPEGRELEGLLVRPPGLAGKAPLVVLPHGGPDDVTDLRFRPLTQFLASHGYAVFHPNYRGGVAYGFDFYAANRGRLGEVEQADIESGVDALVAAGVADPARLFFGGWSWGGYLTAWTIGHQSRYRAAVAGAAVVEPTYQYAVSDVNHGETAAWEYRGDPWRQPSHFDRASPLRAATAMRTPTLVLHGQADERVPFDNGVMLWRALEDVGCEVRFVAYPREPHGLKEPSHLVHRLAAWLDWYERHGGAAAR